MIAARDHIPTSLQSHEGSPQLTVKFRLFLCLLEQRIGRLDRIGQTGDIHVPYCFHSSSENQARWLHKGLNAFTRPLKGALASALLPALDELLDHAPHEAASSVRKPSVAISSKMLAASQPSPPPPQRLPSRKPARSPSSPSPPAAIASSISPPAIPDLPPPKPPPSPSSVPRPSPHSPPRASASTYSASPVAIRSKQLVAASS